MKLHDENDGDFNRITAYDEKSITVNAVAHRKSLIVSRNHIVENWPVGSMRDLSAAHMAEILDASPQIVLLGSGAVTRPETGDWAKALVDASIGFEVMSTAAACRTFNIIAGEGRSVVAALIIEQDVRRESCESTQGG